MQVDGAAAEGAAAREVGGEAAESARLRAQVANLEGERERRVKLEKLLEVQTVQVDLQKELRVKTESLLQVEQQTSSKLRAQLDEARTLPATPSGQSLTQARQQIEDRFAEAQERIHALEQQLASHATPETTGTDGALQAQLEEQEAVIKSLRDQMEAQKPPAGSPEGDALRLQLLLQSRDKHLDELSQQLRKSQNEVAEAQSEADVLRNQVRVLKKEVSQRAEEMERQLHTERSVRAEGFQLKAKLEQLAEKNQEEMRRSANLADTARLAEDSQRRNQTLEQQLADEKASSKREREQLAAEAQSRLAAKDTAMKNQTSTIEALTRELKEKQAEVERLVHLCGEGEAASPSARDLGASLRDTGELKLPPIRAASPRGDRSDEAGSLRSTESLQRQLKSKDAKIAKQSEKVQALTEMLEKRDQQIEELATAKRDREGMQGRVAELEEALKGSKVGSHAEAERRLIDQEQRLRIHDKRGRELQADLDREREEKQALGQELAALRASLSEGASSSGALQGENARLSAELAEAKRILGGREEELRRLREKPAEEESTGVDAANVATLPAMQRRLQRLEQVDKPLGRDVVLYLQERENKIGALSSQLDALRSQNELLEGRLAEAQERAEENARASPPPASTQQEGAQPQALSAGRLSPPSARASPEAISQQSKEAGRRPRSNQTEAPGGPLGADADRTIPSTAAMSPPLPPPHQTGTAAHTYQDMRDMSTEDIRGELISRRQDNNHLEAQLEEKRQLVLKLIEEANLCNAEVASLQQTVQHAQKKARKQDREYEMVLEEKNGWESMAKQLQQTLTEKEEKVTKMFKERQADNSGNAAMDQVDQKGWKLKVIAPRQHEIRHSVFLVLNRRSSEPLDKLVLSQGLGSHFGIAASRIEIVEDTRMAGGGDEGAIGEGSIGPASGLHSAMGSGAGTPQAQSMAGLGDLGEGESFKRDLVLVNIADVETNEAGEVIRSTVFAIDVLDQVRGDMLKGHRMGAIDGILVDAVFINHGDMLLPFEWPAAQSRLLMREGRVLAGKHTVVTIHEVRDPYILRVVAFDSEVGREFLLYLNTRDVTLLLDTRDSEAFQPDENAEMLSPSSSKSVPGEIFQHLQGPLVQLFRQCCTVSEGALLEAVVSSLSFSVFNGQQILVASEMRIPSASNHESTQQLSALMPSKDMGPGATSLAVHRPAVLPERGVGRGLRPPTRAARRLFEDVVGFEGRLCLFSLVHTSTSDLSEDVLRASIYYPKTSRSVEANLTEPMVADRLRIVSEGGELDVNDAFHVVVVVEEVVYPPAFVVRLTSVSLEDAHAVSPQEATKPHTHIIRVSKDGAHSLYVPDVSFAIGPSAMRNKLLWCIGLSTPVHGPRETIVKLPGVDTVTDGANKNIVIRRTITGHPNERFGLTVHLLGAGSKAESERAATSMAPAMKAQLRAKYGKGRLLVRHGRMLPLRGKSSQSIRAVISVYERSQPYHHFVMNAYEPQTSREWEVIADSIDIFKLFSDREERRAQDLANPVTRERIAHVLVQCVELTEREDEIVLIVSPSAVREQMEKRKLKDREEKQQAIADKERDPEVAGREDEDADAAGTGAGKLGALESFDSRPAATSTIARATGGFTGEYDRSQDIIVDQKSSDKLYTAERRLAPRDTGVTEPYRIQIYDDAVAARLHNYIVVCTPIHDQPLAAAGLPIALSADPANSGPGQKQFKAYTLKVDDRLLDGFLWDTTLLEPSRQEELLNFISQSVHLDEDATGTLRLCMRKKKLRAHQMKEAKLRAGEQGGRAPASLVAGAPDGLVTKHFVSEVGGSFPLHRLRLTQSMGAEEAPAGPAGPSLFGDDEGKLARMFGNKGWKKIYCMAQRLGGSSVIISVSKREDTFKLGVYEPESSALYEMSLVTSNSSTPMNVLIERCELSARLDLMLVMQEQAFPHMVVVNLLHIGSGQEFHLKIGDEQVFTMIENSRREAFLHFFDQLITWGCIGFHSATPLEEQASNVTFDETFAGNQMFEKAELVDPLEANMSGISTSTGELRMQPALPPNKDKKVRVPVIRTHLDFLGKKDPTVGISMYLLYHAEHKFGKDNNSLIFRVHKKVASNDVAITLRLRSEEALALPSLPSHVKDTMTPAPGTANGRHFETPALGIGEAAASRSEVTIWIADKCSRAPCGAFGGICEVPGFNKQLIVLATDEDTPRVMRVAVALALPPFTVLFQAVLLESSEPSAKVEAATTLKHNAGRKVLLTMFQKYTGSKQGAQQGQAVVGHLTDAALSVRELELRKKLNDISAPEGPIRAMGVESGPGTGEPQRTSGRAQDESVDVAVVNMTTRRKLGRMMVFTVYRDLIAQNLYLRVVMHDPGNGKDSHLSLLHYTTQRLLNTLRINRDMLEESHRPESDADKQERQQLRSELGKLIVDHLYLVRINAQEGEEEEEEVDNIEQQGEEEEIEYELRMRDMMDSALSADLTVKQKLLEEDGGNFAGSSKLLNSTGLPAIADDESESSATCESVRLSGPRTLLDMKDDSLLYKAEKLISGRRVLIAIYNETKHEDVLNYSHNIRIVVASAQSLDVLAFQDFHEDTLDMICGRRGKRHLMSAMREHELVKELWECLALQHVGQKITGITFSGMD